MVLRILRCSGLNGWALAMVSVHPRPRISIAGEFWKEDVPETSWMSDADTGRSEAQRSILVMYQYRYQLQRLYGFGIGVKLSNG